MTMYNYVSVHEYTSGPKEGNRFIKFGKGDKTASDIQLPTPDNDVDVMEQMDRERVLVYTLPRAMTKADALDHLLDVKPSDVWDALDDGREVSDA